MKSLLLQKVRAEEAALAEAEEREDMEIAAEVSGKPNTKVA